MTAADLLLAQLSGLILDEPDLATRVALLNKARAALHAVSPFRAEPVDFVEWVPTEQIVANDYNPNSVAPPEMELLRTSIEHDGYTQPVVTMPEATQRTVVDGFHRNRVAREYETIRKRVHGFLPCVSIRHEQRDRSDRIASTIRHNRARGKHQVQAMSDIVLELKRRNWSDEKVAKELGMDPDEVLRLTQITGLAELFAGQEFSQSWDVDPETDDGVVDLTLDDEAEASDGRVFHTWEKWECYRAGFYEDRPPKGMTADEATLAYATFLRDTPAFQAALSRVLAEWPMSCEHYLSNENMNRIAWLGQASACIALGLPASFRTGYHRLSESEQLEADNVALAALNEWVLARGGVPLTLEGAGSKTVANLY